MFDGPGAPVHAFTTKEVTQAMGEGHTARTRHVSLYLDSDLVKTIAQALPSLCTRPAHSTNHSTRSKKMCWGKMEKERRGYEDWGRRTTRPYLFLASSMVMILEFLPPMAACQCGAAWQRIGAVWGSVLFRISGVYRRFERALTCLAHSTPRHSFCTVSARAPVARVPAEWRLGRTQRCL